MKSLVSFITGASRGFGLEIVRAALERGDAVVAAARDPKVVERASVSVNSSWVLSLMLLTSVRPNRHATEHARLSKHPVIASAEPGERWLYCYPDEAFAEY